MISYKKDPLLRIDRKNVYRGLVKYKDLKDKNFTLRTPTVDIVNKEEIIRLTEEKYGDFNEGFREFIKNLEEYVNIKFSSLYKTKYRYLQLFKKNKGNIVFLRVISICLGKNNKENHKLFDNFIIKNQTIRIDHLILPLDINKRISYIIGVIVGDGHLDKLERRIEITDGQSDREKLKLSEEFIEFISKLFNKEFNINGRIYKPQPTYWKFYVHNKWLSRYFNHYFEIPFGEKSGIIGISKNIKDTTNEKYFWRGLMDTDGFISKDKKRISIKSKSHNLVNQLENFFKRNRITTKIVKDKKISTLNIFEEGIYKYSKILGFSHPRKKNILIDYLKKGPSYKVLKEVNPDFDRQTREVLKYLRPYKNSLVYIKQNLHHQKGDTKKTLKIIKNIQKIFKVKVTEVNRPRLNNHFYIYSENFRKFIEDNTTYDLPWQPLNKKEIDVLLSRWKL